METFKSFTVNVAKAFQRHPTTPTDSFSSEPSNSPCKNPHPSSTWELISLIYDIIDLIIQIEPSNPNEKSIRIAFMISQYQSSSERSSNNYEYEKLPLLSINKYLSFDLLQLKLELLTRLFLPFSSNDYISQNEVLEVARAFLGLWYAFLYLLFHEEDYPSMDMEIIRNLIVLLMYRSEFLPSFYEEEFTAKRPKKTYKAERKKLSNVKITECMENKRLIYDPIFDYRQKYQSNNNEMEEENKKVVNYEILNFPPLLLSSHMFHYCTNLLNPTTCLCHYRTLLIYTFKYVSVRMHYYYLQEITRKFHEYEFYTKILTVVYLRLPLIQSVIFENYLKSEPLKQWHQPNTSSTNGETEKKRPTGGRSSCYTPTSSSQSSKWKTKSFSYVFYEWCQMENIDDYRQLYPRNNPEAYEQYTREFVLDCEGMENEITEALESPLLWKNLILEDGEFTYRLLMNIFTYWKEVTSKITTTSIHWKAVPGYSFFIYLSLSLLKEAFWLQWWEISEDRDTLVEPSVSSPPSFSSEGSSSKETTLSCPVFQLDYRGIKYVIQASSDLLMNPALLNLCILSIFQSTNLHDRRSVSYCINLLSRWFRLLHYEMEYSLTDNLLYCTKQFTFFEHKLPIDHVTFCTGLNMILRSDHFEILRKTLWFLYERMDQFVGILREMILKILLYRFFTLFLHWHPEVRYYYHYLLTYRICIYSRRTEVLSVTDKLLIHTVSSDKNTQSTKKRMPTLCITLPKGEELEVLKSREQALWKPFDACLSIICCNERLHTRERIQKYQTELLHEMNRLESFENLQFHTETQAIGMMTERRPRIAAPLPQAVHDHSIYYLRDLSRDENQLLETTSKLIHMKYDTSLEVYAQISLLEYSIILQEYYDQIHAFEELIEPPLLVSDF